MSIWDQLAAATADFSIRSVLHRDQKQDRRLDEALPFTVGMISLAAKMAKADGVVTKDEVHTFKKAFKVSDAEMKDAARAFNLAKQDVAGYERQRRDQRPSARRRKLQQSTVLWVDDRPENNLYERRALEALGIHIDLANDSQEALRKLSSKEYDLVISDMARPSSKQAGYELLKLVRDGGNSVPFIIYAGSNLPQHRLEAENRGAQGSTNDPKELFELAVGQLLR